MILQHPSRLLCVQSFLLLILCAEIDANTVDAMPFILGISKPLALEDVSQMAATVVAYDLRPHHAQAGVRSLTNSVRHGIPKRWPAAARVELVVGFVERCVAGGACVDAGVGVVLVIGAGAGHFGALLAEDAELLYHDVSDHAVPHEVENMPGDSCACHSPSVFCTG